jgi:hypothetical protein
MGKNSQAPGKQIPPAGGHTAGHNDPGGAMGDEMQIPPAGGGCSGFNDNPPVMGNETQTAPEGDGAPNEDWND